MKTNTPTLERFRLEEHISKWGREWVIWDGSIKLVGFFNQRSANANLKRLQKDPNYRGW